MDIRSALKGQYHAALAMLKDSMEKCPLDLWVREEKEVPYWRVAYHTLFFTHLYLQEDNDSFTPWKKTRPYLQNFNAEAGRAYTKAELKAYWKICDRMVDRAVEEMDLDRKECGFHWYNMPKLDHQFVNIRHIQHHAGILAARLRKAKGVEVRWVGHVAKNGKKT